MKIEVAYASESKQVLLELDVPTGCLVREAIAYSDLLGQFPEIDLTTASVGVFSKRVSLEAVVEAGDRIEIYRPLVIDPKAARHLRSQKTKS